MFASVLRTLNEKKLPYVLLRSKSETVSTETELDILIRPQDTYAFKEILKQHDFVCWKNRKFLKKQVYARFDEGLLWLMDVHYAFVQNGLIYMDLDEIADRLKTDENGFFVLAAEESLLHYFYHNLIGKKYLQPKHLEAVRGILKNKLDAIYLQKKISDNVIQDIFNRFTSNPAIYTEKNEQVGREAALIQKRLLRKKKSNYLRVWFRKYIAAYVYRNRGVHFAFMGVDGAGKSSVINALEHKLKGIKGVKYKVVYMGPWGQSRSPWHKWVLKKQLSLPKDDEVKNSALLKRGQRLLKGWIYYASVYFELWYRYFIGVRPALRKGKIVLSDRYMYDLRHIYKKRPVSGFAFTRWFICRFFPKPDMIIFLHNDPEVIVKRKPQLDAQQIRLYQKYYIESLKKLNHRSVITNERPEEIAGSVLDDMLTLMLKTQK